MVESERFRFERCVARRFGPSAPMPDWLAQFLHSKPEGSYKFAAILADKPRQLLALDRYERRALSRRKSAIRAFDAACDQRPCNATSALRIIILSPHRESVERSQKSQSFLKPARLGPAHLSCQSGNQSHPQECSRPKPAKNHDSEPLFYHELPPRTLCASLPRLRLTTPRRPSQ
jgi:hypothetical protein